MEKKEKVKSTRYVDGEAVDAVDDEVMPHTHTYTHTHTHTYIHTLPVMSIPSIHLPYRY